MSETPNAAAAAVRILNVANRAQLDGLSAEEVEMRLESFPWLRNATHELASFHMRERGAKYNDNVNRNREFLVEHPDLVNLYIIIKENVKPHSASRLGNLYHAGMAPAAVQ